MLHYCDNGLVDKEIFVPDDKREVKDVLVAYAAFIADGGSDATVRFAVAIAVQAAVEEAVAAGGAGSPTQQQRELATGAVVRAQQAHADANDAGGSGESGGDSDRCLEDTEAQKGRLIAIWYINHACFEVAHVDDCGTPRQHPFLHYHNGSLALFVCVACRRRRYQWRVNKQSSSALAWC